MAGPDLSGSVDGKVQLWLFGLDESQFEYESPGTSRVTQLHFDMFGNKFGMTDQAGNLNLWRFGSDDQAVKVWGDMCGGCMSICMCYIFMCMYIYVFYSRAP